MLGEFPDYLLTGHPVIDAQHREIYKRMSGLLETVGNHATREELEQVLDFFLTFVVGHFRSEEKLMEEYGYGEMKTHVAQHNQFTMISLMLRDEYKASGEPSVLYVKLAGISNNWFREHILGTDKKMAEYIRDLDAKAN
jgi:hemerythrin